MPSDEAVLEGMKTARVLPLFPIGRIEFAFFGCWVLSIISYVFVAAAYVLFSLDNQADPWDNILSVVTVGGLYVARGIWLYGLNTGRFTIGTKREKTNQVDARQLSPLAHSLWRLASK